MKLFKTLAVSSLFTLCAAVSSIAAADVITFDDLVSDTNGIQIANGYHGFNWDNMYVLNGTNYGYGYAAGATSGSNVALDWYNNPASFSRASAFTLVSMDVTKAWNAGVTHFDGYVNNVLTYQMDVTSSTSAPTLAVFNWAGVDKVTMSDGNGTFHTAIDSITVSAVPEPETAAMMLAGLGMLGFMARRRKA